MEKYANNILNLKISYIFFLKKIAQLNLGNAFGSCYYMRKGKELIDPLGCNIYGWSCCCRSKAVRQ